MYLSVLPAEITLRPSQGVKRYKFTRIEWEERQHLSMLQLIEWRIILNFSKTGEQALLLKELKQ